LGRRLLTATTPAARGRSIVGARKRSSLGASGHLSISAATNVSARGTRSTATVRTPRRRSTAIPPIQSNSSAVRVFAGSIGSDADPRRKEIQTSRPRPTASRMAMPTGGCRKNSPQ
jgi:hypothetical protein